MVDSILASLRVLREEPPRLEPVDVAEVVEAIVDVARVDPPSPPAGARRSGSVRSSRTARADLLGRLLEYLLENAAKYAPLGGRIEISGWRDGGRVLLAVTDDGPGIPAEWRERIFEPFVRRDDSPRGAGIGLFAARHLARAMNGELRARGPRPGGQPVRPRAGRLARAGRVVGRRVSRSPSGGA